MKVLYVNACVRPDSRTAVLAKYALQKIGGEVDEVLLNDISDISPLKRDVLDYRGSLLCQGEWDNPMFSRARQFAAADFIVIAAPYWDLSFPALLKIYFESINVLGITFSYGSDDIPRSLCKAKNLLYITTAGGQIVSDEYGFGYVKELCRVFYGINDVRYVKAEGLDLRGADIEGIMKQARSRIDSMFSVRRFEKK